MSLAAVADQMQLGYLSMQNVIDSMKELEESDSMPMEEDKQLFKKVTPKKFAPPKKGAFQVFDLISKSHLNSRLWIKSRLSMAQYMLNQLIDSVKVKGNYHANNVIKERDNIYIVNGIIKKGDSENILSAFGDLSYYCQVGIEECMNQNDVESRAQFQAINASLSLVRGESLRKVISELQALIAELNASRRELSTQAFQFLIRYSILAADLEFATGLVEGQDQDKLIDTSIEELLGIQNSILFELQLNGGEELEKFVEKKNFCYDNLNGIKNLFNSVLHFLVHVKLRLGSLSMLRAVLIEAKWGEEEAIESWKQAQNIFSGALELNKVIAERSVALEIELNLKSSRCLVALYGKNQAVSLNDVVEAYIQTIALAHGSTHDLTIMRTCYQEIGLAFISTMAMIEAASTTSDGKGTTASTAKGKRINTQLAKATEAAICALGMAQKVSNAMRNRMLLPGHRAIKNAQQSIARQSPAFVQFDLLAYWVISSKYCKTY